jgi:hypothetical protein
VALAFIDMGVGSADRAAVVVAVGFFQDLWVLHISICITPETMSTFENVTGYSKGNRTVPGKVATTRTEDGHKQNT